MKRSAMLPAVAIVVLAACAWLNYDLLTEAYGSGPPYYGRSVNMDKWTSPWPALIPANLFTLAAAGALMWFRRRR